MKNYSYFNGLRGALFVLFLLRAFVAPATAADETCTTCGKGVAVTGDFSHEKVSDSSTLQGLKDPREAYLEDVNGTDFSVTISSLPAGRYIVEIQAVEVKPTALGERVFDVTAGDQVLARGFDIVAMAGGIHRLATIRGSIEKPDDALRGPLKITFKATKGRAKFNAFEILDSSGSPVVSFRAADLADAFSAAATRAPEVTTKPIWRDASKSLPERTDDLISRMSLAEKVSQLKNAAPAIPRLGLPAYDYWNEALHGVANNGYATVFPQSIGGAASWNPQVFRQQGEIIGIEGRAKHNDYARRHNGDSKWWAGLTFWTPNINIFRDPRWGRGQETYGEDPYLTSEIAIAFVKGIQGDHPKYMTAMACVKHFAVHSGPENSRHRFNAEISEQDLFDTYLPQFERVVREAKVAGLMSAYNAVNGVPASANTFLLTDLVRKKWGFDGYIVSDCDAIRDIYGEKEHHYVKTAEEAAALAVKAGCDLCCGSDYNALVRGVQLGLITEKEVDQALSRTLWTRFRLGLFDPAEQVPYSSLSLRDNDLPKHAQTALELARQSIVLLKNNGVLPLDRARYKQIAVIGPNADSKSMLEGNYHGSASRPISILEGIRQVAGSEVKITHAMGSPVTTKPGIAPWSGQDNTTTRPVSELKDEALRLAAEADLIVYVGGITPAQEGESFDRDSIELPGEQSDLVRALHAIGKPIVFVNCSGSAMALSWEDEYLPAIVQAWYPGQEGGRAVAEVLFGVVNPSGHLPVTFYRATADLPAFTDYSMQGRTYRYFAGKALYPFGHGLSYTEFSYEKIHVSKSSDGGVEIKVDVRNDGTRDGDDVVQIYAKPPETSPSREIRALCGFDRVTLKAGETKTVTIRVPAVALRRWSREKQDYIVPRGNWELFAGHSSAHLVQRAVVEL